MEAVGLDCIELSRVAPRTPSEHGVFLGDPPSPGNPYKNWYSWEFVPLTPAPGPVVLDAPSAPPRAGALPTEIEPPLRTGFVPL